MFKSGAKIDLGLQDATRKVIHRGDVSRKSDNKLEWLDIHLILLDNFFIMTKKKRDRGVDRYWVSKQVIFFVIRGLIVAYSDRFVGSGGSYGRCGRETYGG